MIAAIAIIANVSGLASTWNRTYDKIIRWDELDSIPRTFKDD